MSNLHIFVPYHDFRVLGGVPQRPWLSRVLLPHLNLSDPSLRDNRLGESRLFLSSLRHPEGVDRVGVLNARCAQKYRGFDWDAVPDLVKSLMTGPEKVLCPWPTVNGWSDDWLAYSESVHPGMTRLIHQNLFQPMEDVCRRPSLWGNDFICHRTVWDEWITYWRQAFNYYHGRYEFDPPFACDPKYDNRKPALLYERITTLYFAMRPDLHIVPMPGVTIRG